MCYQAVCGGSVAAAVLGTGAVAAHSVQSSGAVAAATHGTTLANARGTAAAVAHELARTGAPATVMLVTLGVLLVLAGMLMVGLTRRHGTEGPRQLRMPRRIAAPPPRFA